jgi:hypothetical protein
MAVYELTHNAMSLSRLALVLELPVAMGIVSEWPFNALVSVDFDMVEKPFNDFASPSLQVFTSS